MRIIFSIPVTKINTLAKSMPLRIQLFAHMQLQFIPHDNFGEYAIHNKHYLLDDLDLYDDNSNI